MNIEIYSTYYAFAALKSDGSITAWGYSKYGGSGAPTDSDYTKIYSTYSAFAALKSDGSITAWGGPRYGGSGAPTN
jgi:alpha-tubulin suppressor-like RCC1 family protein